MRGLDALLHVSGGSKCGLDACWAHDHPSGKKPDKHLTHGQSMQTGSLRVVRASYERVRAVGRGRYTAEIASGVAGVFVFEDFL